MTPPVRTARSAAPRRAVVVGGGMAGMLAAAALAGAADEVTVVERDVLPAGPEPRRSLPQARHVHVLWSGGARAFERILPGITDRWLAAGARRIPLPTGLVSMTAQGWLRRWPEMQYMIACTRDLLDWVVRERVLGMPAVTLLQGHEMRALEGTAARVTGVRVRTPEGRELTLDADLVVDASGRGSRATEWLRALGTDGIEEAEVDSGLVYASRLYRAPAGSGDFPIVNVQSDPGEPVPGRTATIVPVERERWLVTLSGTRGGEPSREPDRFESFARSIRHPVVGELISSTTPLTEEVAVSRSTVNRRRYFERAATWPDGFVVVGDSVATYNPLYGQGMTVAAQGLVELGAAVARSGLRAPGLAREVQRAIARPAGTAWELATSQDILYPGAVGRPSRPGTALMNRYVNRLVRAATGRAQITRAFLDVITMSEPPTSWAHPDVVVGALRGPGRELLTAPPLTAEERRTAAGGRRVTAE
ncbi:FAD-dependent oxidoreductase [Streptomyces prasinopilosus]|uniref:2-polyprenyl-6-methoxyphenol hydroxylase n=1 Tax=Streptomyces prasinopilosus TaxID=67344 RepID=A0A1G6J7S6_9ACTN|nr:FAD-dependent monooxygenase [Streptomyces prasinopilosus]SDC14405.1 2-polyprenyl-6-methoxyphenol hydroxylase [Streptomyces prasinopilosus]